MASVASNITNDLIWDLTCRSGLSNEWDQIDEEIQQEIRGRWEEIVQEHLIIAVRHIIGPPDG